MVHVVLRFPAGRFHATPWGRHVNEADVEWPPSPWRLLRALVATGYAKHHWTDVPEVARGLLGKLASVLPAYHLPEATHAHTRHYMPTDDKPKLVFDAFAWVGDQPVVVEWPVALDAAETTLLGELVGTLSYLGRAESWVEGELADAAPGGLVRVEAGERPPHPEAQRVPLLAAVEAGTYAPWRDERVAEARSAWLAANPEKKPTKKQLAALEEPYPVDWFEALCTSTLELRDHGWSLPPGARSVTYWRPSTQLTTRPSRRVERPVPMPPADTALLALTSDTINGDRLPRMQDALRRMEVLHAALVSASDDRTGPSPCLTGCDPSGAPMKGHRHASLMPLSLLGGGTIDHVLVHAPMGFDEKARQALFRVRRTWAKNLPTLFVTLGGLGLREDFARRVPALATSRVWVSRTPFVPSRHLKDGPSGSLEAHVQQELAWHGLPAAVRVEVELADGSWAPASKSAELLARTRPAVALGAQAASETSHSAQGLTTRWRLFGAERAERPPPMRLRFGVRLTFDQPVTGPVNLGYACHFGLGAFEAQQKG